MARGGVAVIGGGAWGLGLAAAAARTGGPTFLYSRRNLDGTLPSGVTRSHDLAEIAEGARTIFLAVPSQVARDVARSLGDYVDGRHFIVHGVRGLAGTEMNTISDIVRQETPVRRVGALGGPALASDLVQGKPTVMVCGSHFREVIAAVDEAFTSPSTRIYPTDDLRGLEWASALVGCLVIGMGYAQGMGLSPGLIAAVITRSVSEAARIAAQAGGAESTFFGLSGYGDLLASIAQTERPEVILGQSLARGLPVEQALKEIEQRVEAVELIPRVVAWSEKNGIRAPIFTALTRGVLASRPADSIIQELMTGPMERGA
jgi:glycerol-3-phosphate dehydrogenase (NAD(P)+)